MERIACMWHSSFRHVPFVVYVAPDYRKANDHVAACSLLNAALTAEYKTDTDFCHRPSTLCCSMREHDTAAVRATV